MDRLLNVAQNLRAKVINTLTTKVIVVPSNPEVEHYRYFVGNSSEYNYPDLEILMAYEELFTEYDELHNILLRALQRNDPVSARFFTYMSASIFHLVGMIDLTFLTNGLEKVVEKLKEIKKKKVLPIIGTSIRKKNVISEKEFTGNRRDSHNANSVKRTFKRVANVPYNPNNRQVLACIFGRYEYSYNPHENGATVAELLYDLRDVFVALGAKCANVANRYYRPAHVITVKDSPIDYHLVAPGFSAPRPDARLMYMEKETRYKPHELWELYLHTLIHKGLKVVWTSRLFLGHDLNFTPLDVNAIDYRVFAEADMKERLFEFDNLTQWDDPISKRSGLYDCLDPLLYNARENFWDQHELFRRFPQCTKILQTHKRRIENVLSMIVELHILLNIF